MRAVVFPAAIAAILAVSPIAFAAQTTTGTIKSVDSKMRMVTLDNGTSYALPSKFKESNLRPGEKVRISWAMQNGKHAASDVTMIK